MMEDAGETIPTTTSSVTSKISYPSSCQGVLKTIKCVCFLACVICCSILVSAFNRILKPYFTVPALDYCLALSITGFLSELLIIILYAAGANTKCQARTACGILMIIYHVVMLILTYAACILMTGIGYIEGRIYNGFGIFTIIGFSLEIYFNIVWVRGGPELTALSTPCR